MKRRKRDSGERGRKRRTTAAFALEGRERERERERREGREGNSLFFPPTNSSSTISYFP